jgi:CRP-like cAMP-binding protein
MDTRSESADFLRRNYLFAGLPADHLEDIVEQASLMTVQSGQMLFNRGDPARHFFLVIEGRIELSVVSPTGDKKIIDVIGPGHTFAEAIMFRQQGAFPVSAFGMEDTQLIRIENQRYLQALKKDAAACLVLLGDVSRRLHWQLQEIENLSITNATHRLVRFLLERLEVTTEDRGIIDLDISRQAIAAMLSIKPETLSRLLRRLVDSGILVADGRSLHVSSVAMLKQFE